MVKHRQKTKVFEATLTFRQYLKKKKLSRDAAKKWNGCWVVTLFEDKPWSNEWVVILVDKFERKLTRDFVRKMERSLSRYFAQKTWNESWVMILFEKHFYTFARREGLLNVRNSLRKNKDGITPGFCSSITFVFFPGTKRSLRNNGKVFVSL